MMIGSSSPMIIILTLFFVIEIRELHGGLDYSSRASDVWALGVTLYCLLFGRTPWSGGNEYILYQLINSEDFTVDEKMGYDRIVTGGRSSAQEEGVSSQSEGAIVIGLLERLLDKDCTKRITLEEVKVSHSFLIKSRKGYM